ncbi:hypothetical protein KGY71_01375, partial [Candidatus Bipolaricaulota bacterium]|nr:hypothetical protein [Candidatus Bipolaricaulota bacterium]
MKKLAVSLTILLLIFGASVIAIAEEETKVPFSAVKSSCYDQIDMSEAEFSLLDIGKNCVKESWLEENLSETEESQEKTDNNTEKESTNGVQELKKNVKQVFHDSMGETVNWGDKPKTLKEINLVDP